MDVISKSGNENEGMAYAKRLAEEEEGIGRLPSGLTAYIIPIIAVSWSLFQLAIASVVILDSVYIRAIHLAFGISLVFLNYPMFKRPHFGIKCLSDRNRIPWFEFVIAGIAAYAALYIALNRQELITRYGIPSIMDVIAGTVLIVCLLEGARRVIGPALPVIAVVFCVYAFFGPYMPDLIAFKGVSLNRFISQMTLSTEGIYGIPLDVSATIVFLFVLFGAMLDRAGAGHYFIQLALSLLGGFKGGPAKAAILGSGLTGLVSGSSIANIVTTGTFTIPLMKKVGYPAKKAAAIEVAASTDGQLAPPIMGAAAFIIAEYVNVPYIEVIKAAAIPAFASYAALFFISHIEASKLGLQGIPRQDLPPFFLTLFKGMHYLLPLIFLLVELVVFRHSPELAAFKSICIMALIMILQHPVQAMVNKTDIWPAFQRGWIDLFNALASGARNMVAVALATSAAGIIVGVVALGLGGLITQIIDTISMGNIFLMLVITALASLIIGMGLPTTATYIVMASLTAPAIVTIAQFQDFAVPLMAAHLFCFYFGILADDTPPVGLAAYAASAIARSKPIPTGIQGFMYDIRTAILPFMFIFNTDLILHNIHSWSQGILIFAMACMGNFAFASATQGWLIARNRFYDIPILLCITLILMRPDMISRWIGLPHDQRYWVYLLGLGLFGVIYAMQWMRKDQDQ
ncbi:MAG: TRAP-type transporter, 4TM/12TM fusion protein (permease) [Candidatus Magnetoglobus multicellularis str. Araruama]|uniref:TRAP-type transporter, 4TM/12TM fusion protein (Permease) n=1 Tax=Candidatus Magnetoglobus multicellularis str. Araruama TaxID=890399 RepID=A0A1V1PD31_9BACT|nr:MAG: TRAP-type transporter, 4TM/12TM fusion protein (permease) [Candidatus Magnetoglobus multicellularis str. Araruama]